MLLKPITINLNEYPQELHNILVGSKIFDSSCSKESKVIFIEKFNGFFLKKAPKGMLEREVAMTKFFNAIGLATNIELYFSNDYDWMLTEKVVGEDCISSKYLENPKRLCDTIAELLAKLHSAKTEGCPIKNHTELYLNLAKANYLNGNYDKSNFPDSFGYESAEEAWEIVESEGKFLRSDTLLHGDYCLPNIILNNWNFSKFIDLGNGGIGDRHVDLFWGIWTLFFNLKTHKYRDRFLDAYGRNKVNNEILHLVAAVEVFR